MLDSMKQDVASDGERERGRAEGKQVVVVVIVGEGTEKIWAEKILPRYGRVHIDCHARLAAVMLFPSATHDAATSTATLIVRAT